MEPIKNAGKIVLRGIGGMVKDRLYTIQFGQSTTIGRSRSCDICLDNDFSGVTFRVDEEKDPRNFQSVSRKHVRISFHQKNTIDLEDLSSNGTFIDGKRINKISIKNFRGQTHILLLGSTEKFLLEWQSE